MICNVPYFACFLGNGWIFPTVSGEVTKLIVHDTESAAGCNLTWISSSNRKRNVINCNFWSMPTFSSSVLLCAVIANAVRGPIFSFFLSEQSPPPPTPDPGLKLHHPRPFADLSEKCTSYGGGGGHRDLVWLFGVREKKRKGIVEIRLENLMAFTSRTA